MKTSSWWMIAGLLAVVAGIVALIFPLGASLTATMLVGWGFLIIGLLQLALAFALPKHSGKIWVIIWGLLVAFMGISLLWNPLQGMLVLTFAIGILLVASGIMRAVTSLSFRGSRIFAPMLVSGLLSLALGLYILFNYPDAAAVLLGVLLAVELLFNGVGLIIMSMQAKRLETALHPTDQ